MNIYSYKDSMIFSYEYLEGFRKSSIEEAAKHSRYFFCQDYSTNSRRHFVITTKRQLSQIEESLDLLISDLDDSSEDFVEELIKNRQLFGLNTSYHNWKSILDKPLKTSGFNVNIVGLGDVGGTLLQGLRLLGSNLISEIGIFDTDTKKASRWHLETSQIFHPSFPTMPEIKLIDENELFDCDMFIFCVSVGVPPIGQEDKDVRLVQFEGNSKILNKYGELARNSNFDGIFAVVSDPVDQLCQSLYINSNTSNEIFDNKGLAPEQIIGYGLGVMNARANFYSKTNPETLNYQEVGRAFGPHGKGLVIANDLENYRDDLSDFLTQKALTANLEVRHLGFKPYIAPALSSGALSIISTLNGNWNYSSTFLGGVFMGCKNRYIKGAVELEQIPLIRPLFQKLQKTYDDLKAFNLK